MSLISFVALVAFVALIADVSLITGNLTNSENIALNRSTGMFAKRGATFTL